MGGTVGELEVTGKGVDDVLGFEFMLKGNNVLFAAHFGFKIRIVLASMDKVFEFVIFGNVVRVVLN